MTAEQVRRSDLIDAVLEEIRVSLEKASDEKFLDLAKDLRWSLRVHAESTTEQEFSDGCR